MSAERTNELQPGEVLAFFRGLPEAEQQRLLVLFAEGIGAPLPVFKSSKKKLAVRTSNRLGAAK